MLFGEVNLQVLIARSCSKTAKLLTNIMLLSNIHCFHIEHSARCVTNQVS